MHTEEEARQRWCPFARIIGVKSAHGVGGAVSGNREAMQNNVSGYDTVVNIMGGANCIASACMAWRVGDVKSDPITGNGTPLGYCGLAGKPDVS